jgi:hypothetical protein
MSDEEFQRLLDELIGGLPVTLVVNRLALTVRALVESGGAPAADLLRALVQMRGEIDGPGTDDSGPPSMAEGGAL